MRKDSLQKITELRHELHRYPELSMQEKDTAMRIRQFIGKNTSLKVVDRGNWFYAVKEGKKDECRIAFRAEMDALPIEEDNTLPYHSLNQGVSHKCGHDGHCAVLCGAALELSRIETDRTVYLIFQPGEETGSGAVICKDLVREEDIKEIFAFHNLSGYPEGSLVYRRGLTQPSSEGLKLHFHGKTSHASMPEEGRNPAGLISDVITFANSRLENNTEEMMLCTVTGIQLGSGDFGISPGEGDLYLTLRACRESRMKELEKEILEYTKMRSSLAGIHLEASVHDYFPETRNDDESLKRVLKAAVGENMKIFEMDKIWRASEDFGWYLKECSGAMFYIGNGEDYPGLHTDEFDFNDRILEKAVDLFISLALHY